MRYQVPRGTFDILPEEMKKRQYLGKVAIELFESYGYQPVETPMFEQTELFQRSIGEATEIVQKEMYTFKDKRGRSLTLRPEGTAPVVRAYLEHNLAQSFQPAKLYYSGPMFRYERPQAGRTRQFWQIGLEAIGSANAAIDAEIILILIHYFTKLGLQDLKLLINSMGCQRCRPAYSQRLKRFLVTRQGRLCRDCQRRLEMNPLRVFDCKIKSCREALQSAPAIKDLLCLECQTHFEETLVLLSEVGLSYQIEPSLVRGFDYYTRTIFEVQSPHLGAQNAIGGGGRYDDLVEEYGGNPTPALGFAIGVERLLMALEKEKVKIPITTKPAVFLALVDHRLKAEGFQLLYQLRKSGIYTETDYAGKNLKAQLKQANRLGAAYVVIIGPDEFTEGKCKIKTMKTGDEQLVALGDVVSWFASLKGDR